MTDLYRQLLPQEIEQLESQSCRARNWNNVLVAEHFNCDRLVGVVFTGECKIGAQEQEIELDGGVPKLCGIYNTHIHNCTIGDNVFINHVMNHIANYDIGNEVIIDNCNLLAVTEESTFGNGLCVEVLDETGGREIIMYDNLSAHMAYLMAFYKHRRKMLDNIELIVEKHCTSISSTRGSIGHNTHIINTGDIKNVRIGAHARVRSASILENGSLHSNAEAPTYIGYGSSLRGFIVASGTTVRDDVLVKNSFIGQGCELGAQYSIENSLFFANCQGFHGEACSIFAGPYTVTHHKSTLLIAGMYSFLNAGSGSNQSNHMYKLGPIHHGLIERGSKTTSDSYILWPARIGAFTLIMGRHHRHSDTSDIPFSYLIENNDESWLVPGINLRSVGTIRDAMKWPRRDKRTDSKKLDYINFNLLSPFTIHKMRVATETLEKIEEISGTSTEVLSYNNTKIKRSALVKGKQLYRMAIIKFLGNSIITRLNRMSLEKICDIRTCLRPQTDIGKGEWLDIAGLIVPKSEILRLLSQIEDGSIDTAEKADEFFKQLHENYYEYEWTWTAEFIRHYTGRDIETFTIPELINFVQEWQQAVVKLDNMLLDDAKKEFTNDVMTGFGIDGDSKIRQQDFDQVRGKFEENSFAKEILQHIDKKTSLANRVIAQLEAIF